MQSVDAEPASPARSRSVATADSTATLSSPDQPDRQLALPRRGLRDCIAEELRRLDADEVYYRGAAQGDSTGPGADRTSQRAGRRARKDAGSRCRRSETDGARSGGRRASRTAPPLRDRLAGTGTS